MMQKSRVWKIIFPVLIFLLLSVPYFRNRGYCYCCFWTHYSHYPIFGRDFAGLYYYYGYLYRMGCVNVYDEKILLEYTKAHSPGMEYFGPPNYPPVMYVLHMPFSFLSRSDAISVSFLLNHLWLFLALLFLNLIFRNGKSFIYPVLYTLIMFPFALLFSPVIENLMSGQINIFLLFLLSFFLFLLCRGRNLAACLVLGLAINVKLFPLCILLYFIVRKEWRMCFLSLGSALLYNVPFLFLTNPVRLVSCYAARLVKLTGCAEEFIWQALPTAVIRKLHLTLSSGQMLVFGKVIFLCMTVYIVLILYYMNRRLKPDDRFGSLFLITMTLHIFFSGFFYVAPIHHVPILIFFVVFFHAVREGRIDSTLIIIFSILAFFGLGYWDGEIDVSPVLHHTREMVLSNDAGLMFVLWTFLLNTVILYILAIKPSTERTGTS